MLNIINYYGYYCNLYIYLDDIINEATNELIKETFSLIHAKALNIHKLVLPLPYKETYFHTYFKFVILTLLTYKSTDLTILFGSTPQLAAMMTVGSACSILVLSSLAAKPKTSNNFAL